MSLWPNLTDSLRASLRVVSSDKTTSAPQEHWMVFARSTILSNTSVGASDFNSFVLICKQILSGALVGCRT